MIFMNTQNKSDREMGLENIMETMYEGESHKCATHVEHSKWGTGECIPEQHATPLYGSVEWYTVMFEHGTEKAYTCDLTILEESHHRHMKKKKKVDEKHKKECDHCKGTGKHGDKKCEKCKGTGVILISADKDSGKPYADSGMMIKFTKDSVTHEADNSLDDWNDKMQGVGRDVNGREVNVGEIVTYNNRDWIVYGATVAGPNDEDMVDIIALGKDISIPADRLEVKGELGG